MNNNMPNNDFEFDLIDFDINIDLSNEQFDVNSNLYNDEVVDLRNSNDYNNLESSIFATKEPNYTSLDTKNTFDIGNLNSKTYNRENIDIKKTSEYNEKNEDNYKFDSFGNKKAFSEIKYTNNVNINNESCEKGLSNNNILNGFYELEIEDYPDRTNLLHLDEKDDKSLGSNTKMGLIDKIFSIKKK